MHVLTKCWMIWEVTTVADIPFVDWNGNGQIDSSDIAQTLAMNDADDDEDD